MTKVPVELVEKVNGCPPAEVKFWPEAILVEYATVPLMTWLSKTSWICVLLSVPITAPAAELHRQQGSTAHTILVSHLHGIVVRGKDGDALGVLQSSQDLRGDDARQSGDRSRRDGAEVSGKLEDLVNDVDLEVRSSDGALGFKVAALDDPDGCGVGRLSLENERGGSVSGQGVLASLEQSPSDGVVRGNSNARGRVRVVQDVVRKDLDQGSGVRRDGLGNGREGLVAGREDGLVADGEL